MNKKPRQIFAWTLVLSAAFLVYSPASARADFFEEVVKWSAAPITIPLHAIGDVFDGNDHKRKTTSYNTCNNCYNNYQPKPQPKPQPQPHPQPKPQPHPQPQPRPQPPRSYPVPVPIPTPYPVPYPVYQPTYQPQPVSSPSINIQNTYVNPQPIVVTQPQVYVQPQPIIVAQAQPTYVAPPTYVTPVVQGPSYLSVACSPDKTTQYDIKFVTWSSFVSGGLAPYTYSWSGTEYAQSQSDQSNVYLYYSSYGPKTMNLTVTSADGQVANVFCGVVNVIDP